MTWSMELQLHRGLPDSAFYCGWNFRTKHQVVDFLFLFSRKTSYWILLGTCIATPNSSPGKKFLTDEACSIVNIFWKNGIFGPLAITSFSILSPRNKNPIGFPISHLSRTVQNSPCHSNNGFNGISLMQHKSTSLMISR